MRDTGRLVHLLRNTPVREIIRALERDGFVRNSRARTGGYRYRHPDGRSLPIHYHTGNESLTRKTLASVLRATEWTEDDLRRLGLV